MQNKKDTGNNTQSQEKHKALQTKLQKEEFHKNVLNLEDQAFLNFFQKKNERIATAVYIITDFFPASEPLKWQLRESCVEVLRPDDVKDKKTSQSTHNLSERKDLLHDLSSLWNLSYYAGYLSDMNFEIVKQELLSLFWLVEAREKQLDNVSIPENFFTLDSFQKQENKQAGETQDHEANTVLRNLSDSESKGHLWDMDEKFFSDIKRATKEQWNGVSKSFYEKNADEAENVLSFMSDQSETRDAHVSEKETIEEAPQEQEKNFYQNPAHVFPNKRPAKPKKAVSSRPVKKVQKRTPKKTQQKSNDRRATILDVVGKKGKVSVKDISGVIQNVSEKTLQRELTAMVNEGVLKKEGERRWSRYSIRT